MHPYNLSLTFTDDLLTSAIKAIRGRKSREVFFDLTFMATHGITINIAEYCRERGVGSTLVHRVRNSMVSTGLLVKTSNKCYTLNPTIATGA